MPPPHVSTNRLVKVLVMNPLEQPEEQSPQVETPASSRKKKMRRWDYYTPSGSETEMAPGSVDLQSHDPRPESVAMAQWAQGLGAPTASTADVEQPVLSRPFASCVLCLNSAMFNVADSRTTLKLVTFLNFGRTLAKINSMSDDPE